MAKIIQATCVYCGKENATSEEYVIPQCLFTQEQPGDRPKEAICPSCNNEEKSANVASLRDFLLLATDSSEHPTAQQLYEKFALAVGRSQSALKHGTMDSRLVPGYTPSGIVVGWAHGNELPREQIVAVLAMIVRGLYHTYTGEILPKDTRFKVYRMRKESQIEMGSHLLLYMGGHYVRIGTGEVFECIYATGLQKPELSRWLLFFYKSVVFSVATSSPLNKKLTSSPRMNPDC